MIKKYFTIVRFIILTSLFYSNLFSQWISKSGVTTYNITDIKFINYLTGFICTAYDPWPGTVNGQLIKTTNNGNTWNTVFTDYHKKFAKIFFVNENTGFARLMPYVNYTYVNNICRTTNGGTSWDTIQYSSPINDFYFINSATGWGVGSYYSSGTYSARILKTTNSGNSWSSISPGGFNLIAVQFPDSLTGFASGSIGNKDIIMKTTNGGDSWIIKDSSFFFQVTSQSFTNANSGFVSGTNGIIIKTTNGGDNWQVLPTGFSAKIYSISFADSQRGWCVANPGSTQYIYYTNNSGSNWITQYSISTSSILNVICMSGINSGWTGGSSGYLLYTINGGSTTVNITSSNIPDNFILYQNFPNPFNSSTNITFKIKESGIVLIKVYDIEGKEISVPVNQNLNPGIYKIGFNGDYFPGGVYFNKMTIGNYSKVKIMVLLK